MKSKGDVFGKLEVGAAVYQPCPECEGETAMITDAAISESEALSRFKHAKFEKFYEARNKALLEEFEKACAAEIAAVDAKEKAA